LDFDFDTAKNPMEIPSNYLGFRPRLLQNGPSGLLIFDFAEAEDKNPLFEIYNLESRSKGFSILENL
jgi:hypothetical protein